MANRQIYQLTNKTPLTTDVIPIQDAAGSQEAKKSTVQSIINLITTVPTASYVANVIHADTASYVINAVSASQASTASYYVVFPYTGSADILGDLNVIGMATITSASITGDVVTNIGDTFTSTAVVTKIVSLSQAEYDGLSPNYDENTLYIVI